jgi:DNA-binding SARP family transcriptional activator/tetratricopeptide (TPR) repeat protein
MLEIRLLGELEVRRDGQAVPLPASRKSRALLAYLAATGKPHLRERLCELLWEGPDDPRAALRWSLTKLRPIVDLAAGRERVELRPGSAAIDIHRIGPGGDALEECAELFRGEFLEGLDLPSCFRYQQWCAGERERFRLAHMAILSELTKRLGATEAALPYARRRVAVDPFNDDAHAALIKLLASLGQHHEAARQLEHCRLLFERELGARPSEAVWSAATLPLVAPAPVRAPAPQGLVGRTREIEIIKGATKPVLILGEPGIGKSRLLDELRAGGGQAIYGRAFAAEMIRPYGVWIDALGMFPTETNRGQLFEAVANQLSGVSLIAIDDLQWIDDASAGLLHYVARRRGTRIVCAARRGEIDDNPHAQRLLRDVPFQQITLGPLSDAETRALVSDERAAHLSGGNPLFALELARSGATGPLMELITGRLTHLDPAARELVSWAAAVGRQFDAEIVGRATGLPAGEMLAALEKLERAAIIRPAGERAYDLTHDLIRDAAYHMTSGPRRTLMHRHIARALRETHDPDGALAGEIVHHASLAGDNEEAARAAVEAGQRCLRLFAYAEAGAVARRGLQIAESLTGNARLETEMRLFEVLVTSRTPVRERVAWAGRIAEQTELARRAGLHETAGLGAHLLAILFEETNQYGDAADATRQSAELARGADPAAASLSMANTARCLLVLQRDIARAATLLQQAQAIGGPSHELSLAFGFLHAHQGRPDEAQSHLEKALQLASERQDHWREWIALWKMIITALEENDPGRALAHCRQLNSVTAKMKGGSEGVRADVLQTIARHASGEQVDLESALARLREADSKSDLAWVLSYLAQRERNRDRARHFAEEALQAAEAVGRHSEAVIARCILGLRAQPTPDITAHARVFLKERRHGRSRHGANV